MADFTPQSRPFDPFIPRVDDGSGAPGGTSQLMYMALAAMSSDRGMPLFGVNNRNMFDRMDQLRITEQHQQMVRDAAKLEQENYSNMYRGMAGMMGQPFGPAQQLAATNFANTMANAAPYLIPLAPNFFDDLGGRRGSPAVMAHFMANAAEQRMDPVTGRFGLSSESANALSDSVYKQMFAGDAYMGSPLPAGRMGQAFQELQARGMMPYATPYESLQQEPTARLRGFFKEIGSSATSVDDMSPGDRDKLMKLPEVQNDLRKFDGKRVAGTLKEWGDALEAMREVFGDAGYPNAPMPQLMNALNQFTSGGMGQMQPGQIASAIRQTSYLATKSGIGMEGAMQLQAQQAQIADMVNLSPTFANTSTQAGLAYARAFQATGGASYPVWGQSDISGLTARMSQLTTSGLASPMINQVALAVRLQSMGDVAAGSDAAKFISAATGGASQFTDNQGNDVSTFPNQERFIKMLVAGSGGALTEGMAYGMLQDTASNQQYINPAMLPSLYKAQDAARSLTTISPMMNGSIQSQLQGLAGDGVNVNVAAAGMADSLATYMFSDKFDRHDLAIGREGVRDKKFGDVLYNSLKAQAAGGDAGAEASLRALDAMGEDERNKSLALMGENAYARANSGLIQRGEKGIADQLQISDPVKRNAMMRAMQEANAAGAISGALAPLGKGSMMSRFMEGLMSGDKNLSELIGHTIGGVHASDIMKTLSGDGRLKGLQKEFAELKDAQENYMTAPTDERDAAEALLKQKAAAFSGQMDSVSKVLYQHGLVFEPPGGTKEVDATAQDIERMRRTLAKGGKLTDEEIATSRTEIAGVISGATMDAATLGVLGATGVNRLRQLHRFGLGGLGVQANQRDVDDLAVESDFLGDLRGALNDPDKQKEIAKLRDRLGNASEDQRKEIEATQTRLNDAISNDSIEGADKEEANLRKQLNALPESQKEKDDKVAGGGRTYKIGTLTVHQDGSADLALSDAGPAVVA